MAHDERIAAYDIMERLARNLANCDDRGVSEAIQDVQWLQTPDLRSKASAPASGASSRPLA